MPNLYMGPEDLNSGPHASAADMLPTQPSRQMQNNCQQQFCGDQFPCGLLPGSSLKRERVATDVDTLPVLLSANLPWKMRNMQIVYIFVSTAGECSPALLFLTLEPQGKDEWSGGRGLSPHCWHGLSVSLSLIATLPYFGIGCIIPLSKYTLLVLTQSVQFF